MRSLLAAVAAATLLAAPALAQTEAPAGQYVVDRTHATVIWKGLHLGLAWYPGRFTNFDIQLTFDPADVTKSKVTATASQTQKTWPVTGWVKICFSVLVFSDTSATPE